MTDPLAPRRFERLELLTLAARGLGKIEFQGGRGATLVTADEIEAMACILTLLGFPPIRPGHEPADLAAYFREAFAIRETGNEQ
ncbi:hypothetical protein [Pseudoruegeria sp. HB172150]|uniref:hypothetical protein n=1 Tax=Pseudoruegeria sp. HB172150 TaxID=2721164 RepID=UPI001C12DB0E|nr:hypothetical protein [Pseudoruegeria sp. HB172150]